MTDHLYTTLSGHELRYPEPSSEIAAFLRRVRELLDDPRTTENEMIGIVYSQENPILDHGIFPTRGAVTREVLDNPIYSVLTDMLFRKHVAEKRINVEQIAARFSLSVPDAAKQLGVQPSSVHRAIQSRRLASWVKGGQHFVDPEALAKLEDVGRRGPVGVGTEPLRYRVGHEGDKLLRLKPPHAPEPDARRAAIEGELARWRRVGVLHGRAGRLRFLVLEPADVANEIALGDLYVRGKFKVEKFDGNSTAAQRAWDDFKAL